MCTTQVLSRKNVKNGAARLSFAGIAAAAFLYALGLAGCAEDNPAGAGEGKKSELSRGPSPITVANLESAMVPVPGGSFTRGCREGEGAAETDTTCLKPAKDTGVTEFYICKFEVTQGLWKEVMGSDADKSAYKGDDLPVTNVTGNQMSTFFTKLTSLDSLRRGKKEYTYRFPMETEWEFAARGGQTEGPAYSGSDNADAAAWYGGDLGPRPVGTKQANSLGIYDMSGSVWETVGSFRSPTALPGVVGRLAERGGSWYGKPEYCRVTYRMDIGGLNSAAAAENVADRGFRIARDKAPSDDAE